MRSSRYLLSVLVVLSFAISVEAQVQVMYSDFPQLAFGGGWSCDFFVNNQELTTISGVRISFYDDNGVPLPVESNVGNGAVLTFDLAPGETKTIRATVAGDTTIPGYALLRRPYPSSVAATMIVRWKSGSQTATQLGLPQQYPVQHYSFPVEINKAAGTNTGIAIANVTFLSAKAQNFVICLIAPDGTLQDMAIVSLPAGGHVSMFLDDPRLFPSLTNFTGTGTISSAATLFGFVALRIEGSALGTVAVQDGSVLPPAQVAGTATPETEPNDSWNQAHAITPPALISGTIGSATDRDYFSFSGKQGDVVTAMAETVGMSSELDAILTLLDSVGVTICSNDQNGLMFQNDSFLHLVLPADGTYYLRVTSYTNEGGSSFVYRLHLINHSAGPQPQGPTIQSLSPDQGSPGSSFTLTINGSNLTGTSAVTFSPSSGITVSNIQSTATQITASVNISSGASTGARQVSVTTPGGTSNALTFTISQGQATPTISSLSPDQASAGSSFTLTISGTNLTGANAVTFSPATSITVSNVQATANQVTASISIGSGATTGGRQVSVTTPAGTSNTLTFTVNQAQQLPHIDILMPDQGSQGTTVSLTIFGSNFTGATAVNFSPSDGITASISYAGSFSLSASVIIASNATLGSRAVSVTTPAGTSNTATFTVISPAPNISSISPDTGSPGISFTMRFSGTNLTGVNAVNFTPSDGITVSNIQVSSSSSMTASVSISSGAALGARTVSLTNSYGTSDTKTFTIVAAGAYDGTWTGTTGQGKAFSFIIIGSVLRRVEYAGSLSCMTFSGWTTANISLGGTIIDFTISTSAPYGVSLDVDGSFTDTSHASGNVKLTVNPPPPGQPGCSGWVQTTWSAEKHLNAM